MNSVMTIEEKARAYDYSRARMIKACDEHRCSLYFMNEIFPEPKVLKDEEMKLTIIQFLEYASSYGCPDILSKKKAKTWIAWLEKQDKENIIEALRLEYERGKSDALQEQRKEWTAEDLLNRNQIADILQEYNRGDLIKWLEKQGESKFESCIQEGDKIVTNEDGTHFNTSQLERVSQKATDTKEAAKKFLKTAGIIDKNGELADEYRLEKQDEQKSTDKVEQNMELTDFESALFTAFSDAWQQYLDGEEVNVAQWAKEHSTELLEVARKEHVEWSEEDEYVYNEILKRVADKKLYEHDLEYIYKWLKSLKPQNNWKPSEEQLKKLHYAMQNFGGETFKVLNSLYEQLKKL